MRTDRQPNPRGFSSLPKRGALALVTTVLAVVLLFSFRPADPATIGDLAASPPVVAAPAQPTPAAIAAGPAAPTSRPAGGTTRPTTGPATTPSPPAANGSSGTFTGNAIDTPYGTVQIELVVQDGKIVDVRELQMPHDRRLSAQISSEAGPMLRDQVITAQSDQINGVSGASYTSYGFYLSLQSALKQE